MKPVTLDTVQTIVAEGRNWARDRRALTSLEYGLAAGVLAVAVLTGMSNLARKVQTQFDLVSSPFEQAAHPGAAIPAGRLLATVSLADD